MSDLESRVVELETRLAFQEQALQELSDALAAARDGRNPQCVAAASCAGGAAATAQRDGGQPDHR